MYIALKNPFRYRSYYYDTETKLYYLNSRYYDPEIGRFINIDEIEILDTTKDFANGINLFAYCLNNPVNDTDSNGNLSWWENLLIAIAGVVIIVGLAIATIATGGTAAGIAGAIFAGALKGALVGAAIGTAVGGAIGYAVGGIDGMLTGLAIGFSGGALIGALVGGSIGGLTYSPLKAASNAAFRATPAKGFNITKHLSDAGGKWSKFNSNSVDEIVKMVQQGLKSPNVMFGPNNSKSWKMIVDLGTTIGTKGQSLVKVIVGYGGKIWTMFPIL